MFQFIKQYIKNPKIIGAIAPSSHTLANAMMEPIDFETAECIVEFGPGTGVFTEELLRRRKNKTTIILIEQNKDFCRMLKQKFKGSPNLFIVHASAEHADSILQKYNLNNADYIISGLPFTSLPKEISLNVFRAAKKIIGKNGTFITFQYTLLKQNFFGEHFRFKNKLHILFNLPPAYVFVLKNK